MRILITGNMGYVGPGVVQQLRATYPHAVLTGFDMGYFANCLTQADCLPDNQITGDIRKIERNTLHGIDVIVHLAAISNDPMGNAYEELTLDVNYKACIALAEMAKKAAVKQFIFASSCSVYGCAEEGARTELSTVNPLTAYAKSKVLSEQGLQDLADDNFSVTCLRFPTACGMSGRLRLDLVLNDFVAAAVTTQKITILSDGSPWRPLINVKDMALAIAWAVSRAGDSYLVVNAGSPNSNYKVIELAEAVASIMPNIEISINKNASPDKRSYQVNFDKFKQMVHYEYQPRYSLKSTIDELIKGLLAIHFVDKEFRSSNLIRLNYLTHLRNKGLLNAQLMWV